jgi:predicted dehydrogenase
MTATFPEPRLVKPNAVPSYRWGVMGAAAIAEAFVAGVQKHTSQQIVAVASRTPGKAEIFANKFGIEHHDSYEELLAREDIDIIYIPTLPTQHREHALMAIAAGKHVLIEKPVALSSEEAAEIFTAAKSAGLLAMEAMWTRYLPQADVLSQLLKSKALGEIDFLNVSMCQANKAVPRLWKLGHGDPFFDMGIYPVSFAQSLFGNPTSISAQGQLTDNGIEAEVSVQLGYASGARAYLLVSAWSGVPSIAQISGSNGRLSVGPEFFAPSRIELSEQTFNAIPTVWEDRSGVVAHEGLSYQATAMASYLERGLLESPLESHEDSIANLKVCEDVIKLIGATIV